MKKLKAKTRLLVRDEMVVAKKNLIITSMAQHLSFGPYYSEGRLASLFKVIRPLEVRSISFIAFNLGLPSP